MIDDYELRLTRERQRLNTQSFKDVAACPDVVIAYSVSCSGLAADVLECACDVLTIVNASTANDHWPNLQFWHERLPAWFLQACEPEKTPQQAEQFTQQWRAMTVAEKDQYARQPPIWNLSGWIDCFDPEQRSWYWWGAQIRSEHELTVFIEVREHPFADGSLHWLLRAAGGASIEELSELPHAAM